MRLKLIGCKMLQKEIARQKNWKYKRFDGKDSLITDLIEGHWNSERFVVLEPGQEIVASADEEVIKVK